MATVLAFAMATWLALASLSPSPSWEKVAVLHPANKGNAAQQVLTGVAFSPPTDAMPGHDHRHDHRSPGSHAHGTRASTAQVLLASAVAPVGGAELYTTEGWARAASVSLAGAPRRVPALSVSWAPEQVLGKLMFAVTGGAGATDVFAVDGAASGSGSPRKVATLGGACALSPCPPATCSAWSPPPVSILPAHLIAIGVGGSVLVYVAEGNYTAVANLTPASGHGAAVRARAVAWSQDVSCDNGLCSYRLATAWSDGTAAVFRLSHYGPDVANNWTSAAVATVAADDTGGANAVAWTANPVQYSIYAPASVLLAVGTDTSKVVLYAAGSNWTVIKTLAGDQVGER